MASNSSCRRTNSSHSGMTQRRVLEQGSTPPRPTSQQEDYLALIA
jgi:hypothetical protein